MKRFTSDVTAWLGNELQNEAFTKLYGLRDKIKALKNKDFDYVSVRSCS